MTALDRAARLAWDGAEDGVVGIDKFRTLAISQQKFLRQVSRPLRN